MAKNLITLDQFKTYKRIKLANVENDEVYIALIKNVSEFIKEYCGRTFIDYFSTDKVELFDAVDVSEVFTLEIPMVSVTSVERSTDGGSTYSTTLLTENTDFFVDYDIGQIQSGDISTGFKFVSASESSIPKGISKRSLRVTYKGGTSKAPFDVQQAAMDLVEYYKEEEYTPRKESGSVQLENLGFRAGGTDNLPSHVKRVLDAHRTL